MMIPLLSPEHIPTASQLEDIANEAAAIEEISRLVTQTIDTVPGSDIVKSVEIIPEDSYLEKTAEIIGRMLPISHHREPQQPDYTQAIVLNHAIKRIEFDSAKSAAKVRTSGIVLFPSGHFATTALPESLDTHIAPPSVSDAVATDIIPSHNDGKVKLKPSHIQPLSDLQEPEQVFISLRRETQS